MTLTMTLDLVAKVAQFMGTRRVTLQELARLLAA
jgi:hypothetical protein